ncbi:MAG TPA: hypothetical protein VFZ24_03810 [Longimicrobiales bacterium]
MKPNAMLRAIMAGLLVWAGSTVIAHDEAAAQRDSLQARLELPPMPMEQAEAPPAPPPIRSNLIFPGVTISSPTALGAERGTVYLGVGYQQRTRYLRDDDDGAIYGGIGLGDASRYVGVELTVASYSTVRTGLFDRVGLSGQVHRFLGDNTAVGVGVENLVMLNGDESDVGRSIYGVVTRLFALKSDPTEPFSLITATLGVGDGRFRLEDDVFEDNSTVGVFGSVSLHVARPVSVIADWTGQDLALGLSLAPFSRFPLVITPAVMDVTRTAGDGARFVLAAGVGYRLRRGPIQF